MYSYDHFFNESVKFGSGVYYYNFRGSNNNDSTPYEVTVPSGFYLFEVWGASSGGLYGGKGGYSVGKIKFFHNTKLYLYVGGQGLTTTHIVNHCISGGWNGGGLACSYRNQYSGGGGTDIRFTKNDGYLNRIIVAGGGGGGADGDSSSAIEYSGGCGGGLTGGPAYGESGADAIPYGQLYALGGSQEAPGESIIQKKVYTNTNGSYGIGGNCAGGDWYCGSGGGGLYGGGGGYDVTGGGGGSGFISSFFYDSYLFNGNQTFPGISGTETGHLGHGGIRITVINTPFSNRCSLFFHLYYIVIFSFFIFSHSSI